MSKQNNGEGVSAGRHCGGRSSSLDGEDVWCKGRLLKIDVVLVVNPSLAMPLKTRER